MVRRRSPGVAAGRGAGRRAAGRGLRRLRGGLRVAGPRRRDRAGGRGRAVGDLVRRVGAVRRRLRAGRGGVGGGCGGGCAVAERPLCADRPVGGAGARWGLVAPIPGGPAGGGRVLGDRQPRPGRLRPHTPDRVGAVLYLAWVAATAVGALGASVLADPKALGLDAAFPALFLALLWPQARERRAAAAVALGAGIALVALPFAPPGVAIVAAAAACLLGVRR